MKLLLLTLFLLSFNITKAQNQNVSQGFVFDGEPYLVINPNNPQHFIVAWMGFQLGNNIVIKSKVSFNSGSTWSTPIYQNHVVAGNTSADVSMAFDHNGNVFMSFIDYNNTSYSNGAVYVSKSTDGGLSWGNPANAIDIQDDPGKFCVDRPWMVIDTVTGPYQGTIYITTIPADPSTIPPFNPYLVRSVDGGNSFEPFRYLDTLNWLAGSNIKKPLASPTVSANGTFYAAYPSFELSQSPPAQEILVQSTSAGSSVSHSTMFPFIAGTGVSDTLAKLGSLLISDPSDADHLAFLSILKLNNDPDVFIWETYDSGGNWTSAARVNDDPINNNRLQDMVWASFDEDGSLAVAWRDRRNASGNDYSTETEIWGAYRHEDSSNFSPNFRISDVQVAHDLVLEENGNDFLCVQLENDTMNVVWGDVRTGQMNVFLNRRAMGTQWSSTQIIHQEALPQLKIYPNPSVYQIKLQHKAPFTYSVYNQKGQLVHQVRQEQKHHILNINSWSSGTYYIKSKMGQLEQVQSFVKP